MLFSIFRVSFEEVESDSSLQGQNSLDQLGTSKMVTSDDFTILLN
jgi:hypothetical protein